ncbi:hypothetical protein [Bradyrhizobium sp. WSM1253]|uniref:hypothetical protein n=1 Tax=Bradyrhizobium sp. WSM1253 TaxID=319003 RepID=UPI0006856EA3|nr:hypothetical protein [Bradyrhizobium sp. WSM1253]
MILKIIAVADARSHATETRAEEIRHKLIWIIGTTTILLGLLALVVGQRISKMGASMTAAMCGEGRFEVVLPGVG